MFCFIMFFQVWHGMFAQAVACTILCLSWTFRSNDSQLRSNRLIFNDYFWFLKKLFLYVMIVQSVRCKISFATGFPLDAFYFQRSFFGLNIFVKNKSKPCMYKILIYNMYGSYFIADSLSSTNFLFYFRLLFFTCCT